MNSTTDDLVVLLAEDGSQIGTAPRRTVHGPHTPLHLAFSLYLRDDRDRVLLTRRALTKATWPGVWTNACCGHPRPGESAAEAAVRRAAEELGCRVENAHPALPDFRYRAVDVHGLVENEICPVFVGRVTGPLDPDPAEVADHTWVDWPDLVGLATNTPALLSPWSVAQVTALAPHGDPWQA